MRCCLITQRFAAPALLFLPPFQPDWRKFQHKTFLFHTRFRVKPCLAHFHPANCMAVVFLAAAQHNILAGAVFHHSVRTGFQWGCFQRLFNLHAKPRQVFRCRRVGCFDPCTIIFAVIAAARFPRPHGLIILPRFSASTLMIVPNPIILLPR